MLTKDRVFLIWCVSDSKLGDRTDLILITLENLSKSLEDSKDGWESLGFAFFRKRIERVNFEKVELLRCELSEKKVFIKPKLINFAEL